jgi:hypothetical protein
MEKNDLGEYVALGKLKTYVKFISKTSREEATWKT